MVRDDQGYLISISHLDPCPTPFALPNESAPLQIPEWEKMVYKLLTTAR